MQARRASAEAMQRLHPIAMSRRDMEKHDVHLCQMCTAEMAEIKRLLASMQPPPQIGHMAIQTLIMPGRAAPRSDVPLEQDVCGLICEICDAVGAAEPSTCRLPPGHIVRERFVPLCMCTSCCENHVRLFGMLSFATCLSPPVFASEELGLYR